MGEYFDRKGNAITADQWLQAYKSNDAKRVALDKVGEADVSTVWLGLDHSFGEGPPLIFETMIFGGAHSEDQWRYSTEDAALAGHARVVAALREGEDPDASR